MSLEPLFCCFKNCNPISIASIAIICNVITLSLIWTESIFSDDLTEILNGILELCSIFVVILIFIYLCLGVNKCECDCLPPGKKLCIASIGIYPAKIIFFFIGELRISSQSSSDDEEDFFIDTTPKYNYFYLFIRLFYIILSIIVPLCANVLCKKFGDIDSNKNSNSSDVASPNEVASH